VRNAVDLAERNQTQVVDLFAISRKALHD
jgi:hypothetical protein